MLFELAGKGFGTADKDMPMETDVEKWLMNAKISWLRCLSCSESTELGASNHVECCSDLGPVHFRTAAPFAQWLDFEYPNIWITVMAVEKADHCDRRAVTRRCVPEGHDW